MGVGFGYLIFKEKNIKTRLFGSAIMVLGICLLTFS
jgi:drug/metabolite transporter (DMT)-like permease